MVEWPARECRTCHAKTRSTSTIDHCIRCGDEDGLRPRHFLTRDKPDTQAPSADTSRKDTGK